MFTYEAEPTSRLERVDGTFVIFYRCNEDPCRFKTEFDTPYTNWTEYFQNQMEAGNVKK